MDRRDFILVAAASVGLALISACGGGSNTGDSPLETTGIGSEPVLEPVVLDWSIGPKGGLGEGSAFITQASWEPKRLEVPLNRPFKIRFTPRGNRFHPLVFSKDLQEEIGMELPILEIRDGQPVETPVMTIKSSNKAFDVFCREHRGVNGFGSIVTPAG